MRIARIRVAGFRGVRDSIDVRVPRGFLVITGRNGSGKTTLCDAIEYALTGTLERYTGASEDRESLNEYIWWRGDDTAPEHYVEIHLANAEGEELVVRRDRYTSSGSVDAMTALSDPQDAPRDWAAQLCRTSIIRDDTVAAFSFDLGETDRFEFVQAAVGSADVQAFLETLKGSDQRLERQRKDVVTDYNVARDRVVALREEISTLKSKLASQEEAQRAEQRIRELLRVNGTTMELLASAKEHLVLLRQREATLCEVAYLASQRTKHLEVIGVDFAARINTVRNLAVDTQLRLDFAEALLTDAEKSSSRAANGQTRVSAMDALTRDVPIVGLREGKCPVCRSMVTTDQLEQGLAELRAAVDHAASALREAAEAVAQAQARVDALRRELAHNRSEVSRIAADAEFFESVTSRLVAAAADADLHTDGIPPTLEAIDSEIKSVRYTLSTLQRAVALLEMQTDGGRVSDLDRTVDSFQRECDDLFARQNKIDSARERAKAAMRTVRHIAGEVLEEKLASLAPLLTDLYLRIRPHANWREVQYHLRGDVRRFLSLRVGPDLNPRFIFSSGQRRATGLAFLLSVHLSRTWCRLDTLVLDDPVQHIDDFRALHFVEVLSAIRQVGKQVICSVEDEDLAALLARRLRPAFPDEGGVLLLHRDIDGATVASVQTVRVMNYVFPFPARTA